MPCLPSMKTCKKANLISCLTLIVLFVSCATTGNVLPNWFYNKESVYPESKYISSIGEGASIQAATENALSQISLYFDTSVSVNKEFSNYAQEVQTGNYYNSTERREIKEQAQINSEAKFYGVSFSNPIRVDNLFYVVAYIDKEQAAKMYKANIVANTADLNNLISFAEMTDNPFYCAPAVTKGIKIADQTSQLIKNVRVVNPLDADDFSQTENLIKRMNSAFSNSRGKMIIKLSVVNDWASTVYKTLSNIMEEKGFVVSNDGNYCLLKAEINPNKSINDAGVFLTCGITIDAYDLSNSKVFSYTNTYARQGAPAQYEEVAWRKSYAQITEDLQSSFIKEFNTKMVRE